MFTSWSKKTKGVLGYITLTIVAPTVTKKLQASAGNTITLDKYFVGEGLTPMGFISNKPAIATVDASTGEVKVVGTKGSAKISYQIGEGKYAVKYKLTVKVK